MNSIRTFFQGNIGVRILKNFPLILAILVVLFFSFYGQTQVVHNLQNNQQYVTNNAVIYDDGGQLGNIGNQISLSKIKSPSGYIELIFTKIDLPVGSTLKIYKGLDTNQLIGFYDGVFKPYNMRGKAFTIVYDPLNSTTSAQGWEGIVKPYFPDFSEKVTLPESDCTGAIPLCSNSTVNTSANQYEDTGLINDDSGGCYSGTGNGGSVWYTFTPQNSGDIDFMISPSGSTDYDYVLWDITNGCENKVEMSCNFSGTFGATGLNSSGTTDSQGSGGTTINMLEAVSITGTYAICINYYSGNNDGFLLNFQNVVGTVAVTDNTPPTITNAYTNNCASASVFNVEFSEYIDCTTLQASDFTIPGYTVALTTTNCIGGKTNGVVITVSPAMAPGSYNLTATNMNDMCGNPMNSIFNINTTIVPTANAGPDQIVCKSVAYFFGIPVGFNYTTVPLTASGGTTYLWSDGQTSNPVNVSPTVTTTYTVTAISGSCSATDQVQVTVEDTPVPNIGADQTVCQGATINLTSSGGGTYQWQSTTSTNFFGNPTGWTNIGGATSASYSTSIPGSTNIFYQVNVLSPSGGCSGSDYMKFTIDPISSNAGLDQLSCAPGSAINLLGTNTNGSTFSWNVGTPTGTQIATTAATTVNPMVATTYYFSATSATGCKFSDAMNVNLANYGTVNNVSAAACDIANITMPTYPDIVGTTSYTYTWFEQSGVTSPCPTSTSGMTQVFTETKPVFLNQSIFSQNFDAVGTSSSLGASPGGWSETVVTGSVNSWGIGNTVLAGMSGNHLQIYNGATVNSYLATDDANKIAKYGPISGTNSINKSVTFNWRCEGENDGGTSSIFGCFGDAGYDAADYGYFCYSLDGVTWTNHTTKLYAQSALQSITITLPAAYDYQNFYIGFRWVNDANAFSGNCGTRFNQNPVMIDNINIQADVNQYPTSSYNPPATTADMTYVLQVTPTGGVCNAVPSLMANCITADCVALPIELNQFDGNKKTEYNKLYWSTVTEHNNDYFTLERSATGIDWDKVTEMNGAGNSTSLLEYEFEDYKFTRNSINYYRLSQTDIDGAPRIVGDIVSIDNRTTNKKIIRKTNILGQDVSDDQKGLIILIYEDGTIEKIYVQ